MKILYLTGGAGQMYCGSCLRDNALAAELIARGHDVTLLPVYTPTLTDEPNVSEDKVFFGGVSVYLEQYLPFFRKGPRWLDHLLDSRWLLQLASRRSISTSPKMLGEMTVSMLKGDQGFQRKEIGKLLDWLAAEPAPDVVSLPYSLLLGLAEPLKKALKRPICCTLQGEDLFLEGLQQPYRAQALELIHKHSRHIDRFIAVSDYYADFMPSYLAVPQRDISMVPLGINLDGYASKKAKTTAGFTIGYFARIAPEKGLHLLAESYRRLRERSDVGEVRVEVAGYLAPEHKSYLEDIIRRLNGWGIADGFNYRGVLNREEKIRFLQNLDVLSVPTIYKEPKGVFLLEAMACGVPVVQPRHGAFVEIIEKTSGGLLVEPENPDDLADAILKLMQEPELAANLSRNAFENVRKHYSVKGSTDRLLEVYESVIRDGLSIEKTETPAETIAVV